MKPFLTAAIFLLVLAPAFSAELSIYIESWNRISFANPNILDESGSRKMHAKDIAAGIAKLQLDISDSTVRVQLSKNFSLGGDSNDGDLEILLKWLRDLGYRKISVWDSSAKRLPTLVKQHPR